MTSSAFDDAHGEHALIWEETWTRFRNLSRQISTLQQFHAEHKYLFMSRSPASYRILGNIAGNQSHSSIDQVFAQYEQELIIILQKPGNPGLMVNALLHLMGYFKNNLQSTEKREMLKVLDGYRQGVLPLTVPLQILAQWARTYRVTYVQKQVLLGLQSMELHRQTVSERNAGMEQRSFLGIQLKGRLVPELTAQVDHWRQSFSQVDWHQPEDWHLTLKFLGSVDPRQFTDFVNMLRPIISDLPGFDLFLKGVGLFYRHHEPSIVWAGISEPFPQLSNLVVILENFFEIEGFPLEKQPYTPHVTLGRIRQPCPETFFQMVKEYKEKSWGVLNVEQISLMARRVDPHPYQYETYAQLELK